MGTMQLILAEPVCWLGSKNLLNTQWICWVYRCTELFILFVSVAYVCRDKGNVAFLNQYTTNVHKVMLWTPAFSAREEIQERLWTSWSVLGCTVKNNFVNTCINLHFICTLPVVIIHYHCLKLISINYPFTLRFNSFKLSIFKITWLKHLKKAIMKTNRSKFISKNTLNSTEFLVLNKNNWIF